MYPNPSQNPNSQSSNALNSGRDPTADPDPTTDPDPTADPDDPEGFNLTSLVNSGNALSEATGSPVKSSAKPQDAKRGVYYWAVHPDSDAQPKTKQEPKGKETPTTYPGMSTIVMIRDVI
jgi:hypothetical protein